VDIFIVSQNEHQVRKDDFGLRTHVLSNERLLTPLTLYCMLSFRQISSTAVTAKTVSSNSAVTATLRCDRIHNFAF
jgi:hypothetical protein